MPVTGRKPKADGQKRNRVKPTYEWTPVLDVPFRGGPRLPAKRLEGKPWPALTKRWWEAVSTMPHCILWAPSDWQFATDTALLAGEFHDGNVRVATELRSRDAVLGTTADARRDLRIRYIDPDLPAESEADATVTAIAAYRQLISG